MSGPEETLGPRAHDFAETSRETEVGTLRPDDLASKPAGARTAPKEVATYREFADALLEIGLLDAAELEQFAADSAEGVLGLSRALVKAHKLTPYQAAAIYQNKSRGLLIGNYLILDKVGQGGMGMVFKARHRKLGRVGALKILPPSFTRDPGAVMRFRREFDAAGRLKHLNLVAAFEADEDRGVHFLVMDFVEGINLDRAIRERGPLPVPEAVDYVIQSARGLEAAHERGIVHRDIKPGNLILDRMGTVRVLDLGLARIIDASNPFSKTVDGRLTQSGVYMGSIDYMAPEQAEDSHSVDHRADIYGLGCTFFFLLTGREPFAGPTMLKRIVAHQEHPAPSLRAIRPDVSPALEAVYQKMMAKKPEERPTSMAEVIALLQASKLSTEDHIAKMAQSAQPGPAAPACAETPPKRSGAPPPVVDSVIFARRMASEDAVSDHELNLRDLVMDVRSDAGEAGTVADDRERGSDGNAVTLRDLALGDEAARAKAPKPPAADAHPLQRSTTPPPAEAPAPVQQPPTAHDLPVRRTAAPRQGETPRTTARPPTADAIPVRRAPAQRQEEAPPAMPRPPSADALPLKRAAAPRHEETPHAASKTPAPDRQPLRPARPPRQEETPATAPQPLAAERRPLRPAAPTVFDELARSRGILILVVVTAILLVVAIVVTVARRPATVRKNERPTSAVESHENENPADAEPTHPAQHEP